MAGADPTGAFNAAFFRSQIRATMTMGLANAKNATIIFRWTTTYNYSTGADPIGSPYSWGATPVSSNTHADVSVPCAFEFRDAPIAGTAEGAFEGVKAVLTLLDEDYKLVQGSDTVIIGNNEYLIEHIAPPQGLFSVDVYTIYASARSMGDLPPGSVVVNP